MATATSPTFFSLAAVAGIAAGASAVAAGSMFVYWGPRRAVLINYPNISAIHD